MQHTILRPSFVRQDERGDFRELLNEGRWESMVHGAMHAGSVLGNHYHKETQIFFFLLSGRVRIDILNVQTEERESLTLSAFEGLYFFPYESHKLTFEEAGSFVFLKSKQYDPQNNDTYGHPV